MTNPYHAWITRIDGSMFDPALLRASRDIRVVFCDHQAIPSGGKGVMLCWELNLGLY